MESHHIGCWGCWARPHCGITTGWVSPIQRILISKLYDRRFGMSTQSINFRDFSCFVDLKLKFRVDKKLGGLYTYRMEKNFNKFFAFYFYLGYKE